MPTASRGDLAAYTESVRLSPAEVVSELRDLLGARLVAYLGSVKETRAVRQWADGDRQPPADVVLRLRLALHVSALLSEKDSPAVVQSWFQGTNPVLGDVSPARLLRDSSLDGVGAEVLVAARAFRQGA